MSKSPTPKAPRRASATKSAAGPAKSRKGLKATQAKAPATSRRRKTMPPPVSTVAAEAPATKQARLIALIKQAPGASLADLTAATGWQAHSVRGAISGVLRKRLQLPVISETVDGTRRYRIAEPV
ncbi:DUF3489 domain-containing protein [uncultured Ralstonia sp.]|uniref:DUF3489 domain-containing protein n=1 Tax=uncultured Ralstonia sp. TaxID=114715 RepID=UPI0025CD7BFB|nr:DUF3489 domain-containing protein [uncultured Ralstonia sp.]